ncbi:Hypothetical protein NTJ_11602 [Nesidiocoris tenuis]|uniref:Uncharacterized protein n=1 Tax=Nesidiocoris tenuis TaxID=355587 RepID=A0ABN7B2Z1_9HEMI|nr:Hypothetical protein NTJ_11602 [Nesidiocoris tenuis]
MRREIRGAASPTPRRRLGPGRSDSAERLFNVRVAPACSLLCPICEPPCPLRQTSGSSTWRCRPLPVLPVGPGGDAGGYLIAFGPDRTRS